MARYHINPETGEPGVCKATKGGCPFGGESDHYDSPTAAREAFEAGQSSFAVVIKKSGEAVNTPPRKEIKTFDAELHTALATAEDEYGEAEDKQDWLQSKIDSVGKAQSKLDRTLPGTPERGEAMVARDEARTAMLAADLVNWRNSPFYTEAVEERMKQTAVVISDADASLESALADERGQRELASRLGLAQQDVTRILEITQEEYLRPRAPRSRPIGELSEDTQYASYTAYAFRIPEENVQEVLRLAARNSSLADA